MKDAIQHGADMVEFDVQVSLVSLISDQSQLSINSNWPIRAEYYVVGE